MAAGLLSAWAAGPAVAQTIALPQVDVVTSRLGSGVTGASTTIITAEDIERAPQSTLVDILAREAGVQVSALHSGVNGTTASVDLRGFGVTGPSNTLVLINGRRQNDSDLPGFDFSTVAKESIERIEITRGNSGAVLYGDGAVGGVINIVTKSGVGKTFTGRVDQGFGTFRTYEQNGQVQASSGPFSVAAFANALKSDGYRDNNETRQYVGSAEARYTVEQGSVFVNLAGDKKHLGLPGTRDILGPGDSFTPPFDTFNTARRGANTLFDYADTETLKATGGFTRMIVPGVEAIVDGGVRRKKQQAGFFNRFAPNPASPQSYVDTVLTTSSVTPRLKVDTMLFGLPTRAIGGIDFFDTDYESDRSAFQGARPTQRYFINQKTLAAYWQHTVTLRGDTDLSAGGRIQRTEVDASGITDLTAPIGPLGPGSPGLPLSRSETNHAWHLGAEHRLNEMFAVFGRLAQSFRVPNVDERVGMSVVNTPTTFDLRTQKSHDAEAGVRFRHGPFQLQTSLYEMRIVDEIRFNAVTFTNRNFDPTLRRGVETMASWQVRDNVRLHGNATYTRATFREGPYRGMEVPQVSPWTANAGVSWDVWGKSLVFDGVIRYASRRYLDQDEANVGAFLIPSQTVVDVRVGGEWHNFYWSFAVQNLFDRDQLQYGLDGSYPDFITLQRVNFFNLYPLAGRTYSAKVGWKW